MSKIIKIADHYVATSAILFVGPISPSSDLGCDVFQIALMGGHELLMFAEPEVGDIPGAQNRRTEDLRTEVVSTWNEQLQDKRDMRLSLLDKQDRTK